jgi:two-component system nitrate/nitrite response regulator NarL
VRRAIRDLLQDAGVVVAAEASNGRDAIDLALHYRPSVVLMDVSMPLVDGLMAAREVARKAPAVRVVMLSNVEDEDVVLLSFKAGAFGFITKSTGLARLPEVVRRAAAGEATVPRRFTAALVNEIRKPTSPPGTRPVVSPLTPREWEVLDLLAAGVRPGDIADQLVISLETVRSHTKNLRRKLGVPSGDLADAARRLRAGGGLPGDQ